MASITLDLLSALGRSASDALRDSAQHRIASQLTVILDEALHVYHDVAADKAHVRMDLVGSLENRRIQRNDHNAAVVHNDNSSLNSSTRREVTCHAFMDRECASSVDTSIFLGKHICRSSSACTSTELDVLQSDKRHLRFLRKRTQAELPFARKASLARFLEKRKERVDRMQKSSAAQDMLLAATKKMKIDFN
ncbi:hypothetical protein KP509_07G034000 [Ceratopteris richardii]|uniref:Uncharacterized protein n=1 Tax=Ceratopteris richardii TaxID=49495 RepID=A0A8T2U9X9_CERRI|nr:hypothetical protein KP509_07G034000 [Ceratopteris richardii]